MQNVIISDTSCLIVLFKINELFILKQLFGSIIITPEVAKEFGEELPEWILVKSARNKTFQKIINTHLDCGESSSIALALESDNPLLILDDLKARNFVKGLNLQYSGTLGIILNAKKNGIIDNVKDVLKQIENTNFRIHKSLIDTVLKLASEFDSD